MTLRRLTLFWHDPSLPEEVAKIVGEFRQLWPDYSVDLFNDLSASDFIRKNFGGNHERLFNTCRIPAMRSDLFRLFSIYERGGVWVDIKFLPKHQPDPVMAELSRVDLICCKWFHGRIVNGVFFARDRSEIMEALLEGALRNVNEQKLSNIFMITGPGLWAQVLSSFREGLDYRTLDHDILFRQYLKKQRFRLSGRGTANHWSERQLVENLYRHQGL